MLSKKELEIIRMRVLLKRVGFKKPKRLGLDENWKDSFRSIDLSNRNPAPLSNTIPGGGGYRKDIDEYKWKRNASESKETIKEIEAKAKRIAPKYNKGAAQYITDGDDLKTLGRKI